ncbi:MAG: class E sortase [Candidatus Humimicrobiaceae bacterium]
MEIRRKRRSTSSIVFLIILLLLVAGGLILIAYPFITSIPSFIERSSHIATWQSLKDKSNEKQNTATSLPAASETTMKTEDSTLLTQTTINGQEAQSQNSTSSTKAADAAAVQNKENIKYNAGDIFPAKLSIPKISIEWITNEGSDVPDLKKGPGHIPETPLPGEAGRCTISGHRTTYGAPFSRIDELKKGDMIYLEALNGNKYFYQVTSFQVIKPTYVEILKGTDIKELLLTTCYPEYSARERLVIIAEMVTIFPLDLNLK